MAAFVAGFVAAVAFTALETEAWVLLAAPIPTWANVTEAAKVAARTKTDCLIVFIRVFLCFVYHRRLNTHEV